MGVIYRPSGAALEYAPLACNIYKFCTGGCRYCYAPDVLRVDMKTFHASSTPRNNILRLVKHELSQRVGCNEQILFCFTCDPYPRDSALTREVLLACEEAECNATVLTKRPTRAYRDFDILARNRRRGWSLGVSLNCVDDELRQEWEPNTDSVQQRIDTLRVAKDAGIYTWVSIEPVLVTSQALEAIKALRPIVDELRVGKLNTKKRKHLDPRLREMEAESDWAQFLRDVQAYLMVWRGRIVIKEDLWAFAEQAGVQGWEWWGPDAGDAQ